MGFECKMAPGPEGLPCPSLESGYRSLPVRLAGWPAGHPFLTDCDEPSYVSSGPALPLYTCLTCYFYRGPV